MNNSLHELLFYFSLPVFYLGFWPLFQMSTSSRKNKTKREKPVTVTVACSKCVYLCVCILSQLTGKT